MYICGVFTMYVVLSLWRVHYVCDAFTMYVVLSLWRVHYVCDAFTMYVVCSLCMWCIHCVCKLHIIFSPKENECLTDNGGCEGTCSNTYTSYVCSCRGGLQLTDDRHSCEGMLNTDTIYSDTE